MESLDNSELAWGAFLAADYNLKSFIPQIRRLLHSNDPRVQLVAADSCIRLEADVDEPDLAPLLDGGFYNQAIILIASRPARYLASLTRLSGEQLTSAQWTAVQSLLAQAHPPGFAAQLLREWTIHYTITLHDESGPYLPRTDGSGPGSPASGRMDVSPGFPPLLTYSLKTIAEHGDAILLSAPVAVYYRRGAAYVEPYEWDRNGIRAACLRYMAGISGSEQLRLPQSPTFAWTTPQKYRADAGTFRAAVQTAIDGLVQKLVAAHALTAEEAGVRPRIEVSFWDVRSNKSALPEIEWRLDAGVR